MKEEAQKKYMELQMLQHQIQQVQKQMHALDSQAQEMDAVQEALEEFSKCEKGKSMYATLTPGIFVKAKLEETNEVLLNVGGGAVVSKSIPDAKKTVGEQGVELRKLHEELAEQLQLLAKRAETVQEELVKVLK